MKKLSMAALALVLLAALALPVLAAETPYVVDDAQLLDPQQEQSLQSQAQAIAQEFGVGVYILTVEDYRDYGQEEEIFDVLWNYYHDHSLGVGSGREGMILMLSMDDRDFATFFYGDTTEYAFSPYAQEALEEHFLPQFGDDRWYAGFQGYLDAAQQFLAQAASGHPVRKNPWPAVGVAVLVSCLFSGVVTLIQWVQTSKVTVPQGAAAYLTSGGLTLSQKTDRYLRRDVTRRKIETDTSSSGSSTAHSGGGGSGRSGKF